MGKSKSNKIIDSLLELNIDPQSYRVKNRESEHREFKLTYDNQKLCRYAKTMAAFANRDGGAIFFGIRDRPKSLEGVSDKIPEDLDFANFLNEYFEPEIQFSIIEKTYCTKRLMIVLVEPSHNKPIICRKELKIKQTNGEKPKQILRQGAIYFRYSSATEEIKYAELRSIIDMQVQRAFHAFADNLKIINKIGFDKAAIVDVNEFTENDKIASVYLTKDTANKLNWIDKGKFVEAPEDGAKALFVVKKVEIKHGLGISTPTDVSETHPLTKTSLGKETNLTPYEIDAILWKLNLLSNPEYHIISKHGKNKLHNFKDQAKSKILQEYPLGVEKNKRKTLIKQVCKEYNAHKKKA